MAWFGKKKDEEKKPARQNDAGGRRSPETKKSAEAPPAAPAAAPQAPMERGSRLAFPTHEGRRVLRPPRQGANEASSEAQASPAGKNGKIDDLAPLAPEGPRKSLLRPPQGGYREVGQAARRETLAEAQEREKRELDAQRAAAAQAKLRAAQAAEEDAAKDAPKDTPRDATQDTQHEQGAQHEQGTGGQSRPEAKQESGANADAAGREAVDARLAEQETDGAPEEISEMEAQEGAASRPEAQIAPQEPFSPFDAEESDERKIYEKGLADEGNPAQDGAQISSGQADSLSQPESAQAASPQWEEEPDELPSELAASEFEAALGMNAFAEEAGAPAGKAAREEVEEAHEEGSASAETWPQEEENPFDAPTVPDAEDLPLHHFLSPEEIEAERLRQQASEEQERRREEWIQRQKEAKASEKPEAIEGNPAAKTARESPPPLVKDERDGQNLGAQKTSHPPRRADNSHAKAQNSHDDEDTMRARLSGAGFGRAEPSVEEARQAAIDEAAIVFAAGEEESAATKLGDCLMHTPLEGSERVWWMLMDLRQSQNNRDAFEKLAQGYATKFGNSPPAWRAPRQERANTVSAANVLTLDGVVRGESISAQGKPFLAAAREKKSAKIDVARLDPVRSEPEAIAALRQLMVALRKRKVPSLLMGAGPLSRWLLTRVEEARAKSAPDEADSEPWLLLLEIFQWQGEEQMAQFEDLSLAYSMWFELSGPGWDPAGVMPKPAGRVDATETREGVIEPESVINEISGGRLQEKIRSQIERAGTAAVDFSSVRRIDFSAAGAFLNFLAQLSGNSKAVTLLEPSELVMALLDVVGVSSYVAVTPRKR